MFYLQRFQNSIFYPLWGILTLWYALLQCSHVHFYFVITFWSSLHPEHQLFCSGAQTGELNITHRQDQLWGHTGQPASCGCPGVASLGSPCHLFFFFFYVHHLSSPKPPLSCVAAMPFCWCYGGHTPHLGPCPSVAIPSGSHGTLDCSEVWSWPSATGWAPPAVPKPMCVPTASWTTGTRPVCCSRESLLFRKMLLCPTGFHLQNANPM